MMKNELDEHGGFAMRLIETDRFPFEFLSKLGERESWRKEIHRPVYHVHKWWAKRLGSVFRGILLGCDLEAKTDLRQEFYRIHQPNGRTVFDPFMGSGTTIGEAHKLGFTAFGRDINPVAASAVQVALGPLSQHEIDKSFKKIEKSVGELIQSFYKGFDKDLGKYDVLYYFWVMQASCPSCSHSVDLFSSYVFSQNAYPKKKPDVQVLCPNCGEVTPGLYHVHKNVCSHCSFEFDQTKGPVKGAKASCTSCKKEFSVGGAIKAESRHRPGFRMYAKMVLASDGTKHYLRTTDDDIASYESCKRRLKAELRKKSFELPSLELADGHNTRQAIGYNFTKWTDFFNDRQLLALGLLHSEISKIEDHSTRNALLTVFSGALEFNNLFASFKGEGTGAVRHMFSHHILKPERTPIEANLWGTPKSSGSFLNLYRNRLGRALAYRAAPTEIGCGDDAATVCSLPFSGDLAKWGASSINRERAISISCGDSSKSGLPANSIDYVVTDPPFFDNVHYSELADFFHAWQQLQSRQTQPSTTRSEFEVQDKDSASFARKLTDVFREADRVLKDDGLLVFTYHHSRAEGWESVAAAVLDAGFAVVNAHPVKSEMSVATPKAQASDPIQFDIIVVCRKRSPSWKPTPVAKARESAHVKISRLQDAGFELSNNDQRVVLFGQLLTTLKSSSDSKCLDGLLSALVL
jgi:putative DNA methylase